VSPAYRAVLFDLFGTLVVFDWSVVPEIVVDGRPMRSTMGSWAPLFEAGVPGIAVEDFARALLDVSIELDRERIVHAIEPPARERFRRALERVGTEPDQAAEMAPLLARAHMRVIADATRCPPQHRDVLARACANGPVAIVSNFDDTAGGYEILERHGIRAQVQSIVVSESVGLRKPNPTLVRIALHEVGVASGDAVLVGDNLREDVGAASAAGVDAVWIDASGGGVSAEGPTPRHVVRRLADVGALLF
jgi:HAD superfamily hydrolase (TIGR01549 family)